jgi:hypothetical protein
VLRRDFIKTSLSMSAMAAVPAQRALSSMTDNIPKDAAAVNVLLWFDTEDYINPEADDAALRIAKDLSEENVPASFKVVGQMARMLEMRGRHDVIEALRRHDIGYHSDWHSLHPVPAEYLEPLGYLEGADEFQRREASGIADVARIFRMYPSCYGQPGFSWAPQPNLALRRLGIPVYLDHANHIGIDDQPFYLSNLFYVLKMGNNYIRPSFSDLSVNAQILESASETVSRLSRNGGGTMTTWMHPNECVETEYWDAINFNRGANPAPDRWIRAKMRTRTESEACYRALRDFVLHLKANPKVRWLTASEVFQVYEGPIPPSISPEVAAKHFEQGITFLETPNGHLSAAEVLLQMFGLGTDYVDGPTSRGETTYPDASIDRNLWESAKREFADSVRKGERLPAQLYLGARSISLADFAATAAVALLAPGDKVKLKRGDLVFEHYVSTDTEGPFRWGIHAINFSGPHILELTRLQAWTLKPAKLRP